MPYLFATQDLDYSDYASGRVIYNLPGAPAFPVRLASEIFQRARSILGTQRKLALYDPTCGAAYHLCALGFLHGEWIESITASDLDEMVLPSAVRNLGLLSQAGFNQRVSELQKMLSQYGKPSHAEALQSAMVLRERLKEIGRDIPTRVFQANALDSQSIGSGLSGAGVDLVFSDIPYGNLSTWRTADGTSPGMLSSVAGMLDALLPVVHVDTIIAIAANKQQKASHPAFRRIAQFGIGKRQITLLSPQG